MTIRQMMSEKALLKNEVINNMLAEKSSTREELTSKVCLLAKEIFLGFSSIDALLFGSIAIAIMKDNGVWNLKVIIEDGDKKREIESGEMKLHGKNIPLDMEALRVFAENEGLIFTLLEEDDGCAFSLENI